MLVNKRETSNTKATYEDSCCIKLNIRYHESYKDK